MQGLTIRKNALLLQPTQIKYCIHFEIGFDWLTQNHKISKSVLLCLE